MSSADNAFACNLATGKPSDTYYSTVWCTKHACEVNKEHMEACEHFVVMNRTPEEWMWSIKDLEKDLYDMEEPVISMTTKCIHLLQTQILQLQDKGELQVYKHQSAEDLADTLDKLMKAASTATARVLTQVTVNTKKEQDRIKKLRQAENVANNKKLQKKQQLEAKHRAKICDEACAEISKYLAIAGAAPNNSKGLEIQVSNGRAVFAIINKHNLTSAEMAFRVAKENMAHLSPYLQQVSQAASKPKAPEAHAEEAKEQMPQTHDEEMDGLPDDLFEDEEDFQDARQPDGSFQFNF